MEYNPSMLPFAWAYNGVTWLRNVAYDRGLLQQRRLRVPVVSVGNITTGGTGKSPMIECLIRYLVQQGISPGVVSRGYKGEFEGIQEVELSSGVYYGDEPMMIKSHYPKVPFFVGGDRVQAAEVLLKRHPVQLILADDAFQHRRLKRDLDILLIDATQDPGEYKHLPVGFARESMRGLQRVDRLVFTKTNLPEAQDIEGLREWLRPWLKERVWREFVCAEVQLGPLQDLFGKPAPEDVLSEPVYLISALARPASFQVLVERCYQAKVEQHFVFPDHHKYRKSELESVLESRGIVVTTEKDAVKLKNFYELHDRLFVAPLRTELTTGAQFLYNDLKSLTTGSSAL